mgnify:CR=1 FL=1
MLSTHDQHQIAYVHKATGIIALAPRAALASADPRTIRTAFTTSFVWLRDIRKLQRGPFPRGAAVDPNPAEERWAEAVQETLDAYDGLSAINQRFADLQAMWRGPAQETL